MNISDTLSYPLYKVNFISSLNRLLQFTMYSLSQDSYEFTPTFQQVLPKQRMDN